MTWYRTVTSYYYYQIRIQVLLFIKAMRIYDPDLQNLQASPVSVHGSILSP